MRNSLCSSCSQVVQDYLQPCRRNSLLKCAPQMKIARNPLFLRFKIIQGHRVDTIKKLVTSACYDKQYVCVYLQLVSC